MGWRGALRSIAAAQRAAERDSIRRQRHLERVAKAEAKQAALQQAAFEVEQFEDYLERIVSVHQDCGPTWNWEGIARSKQPSSPTTSSARESAAQRQLDTYTPSFFDRLFRRVQKRRNDRMYALQAARRADEEANKKAEIEYEESVNDWKDMRDLAERILRLEPAAFKDAVEELKPFRELADFGSQIGLSFRNDNP